MTAAEKMRRELAVLRAFVDRTIWQCPTVDVLAAVEALEHLERVADDLDRAA